MPITIAATSLVDNLDFGFEPDLVRDVGFTFVGILVLLINIS
jgi:hypothetical protein